MKKSFNKEEIELIKSENHDSVFRVLTVEDNLDLKTLRSVSKDFNDFDNSIFKLLIERLKSTLEVENAIGIAAPQVGILKNIFLIVRVDKPDMPIEVIVNPKILAHSTETVCFEGDGCLSIPDITDNSIRYSWIDVEYYNENGERKQEKLEGYSREDNFVAIIFQHEYDHLQGILFTDKLCQD
jgi:peptide deformylase